MNSLRYVIIVGALFIVLLSAFSVERQRVCADGGMICLAGQSWHPLPVSRLFLEWRERRRAAR